jgi:tetratricopeptide (TPR) repeat protein
LCARLQALKIAETRGDGWLEVRARAGLGLDALGRGDPAAAVDWLEPAADMLARGGVRRPNVFLFHGDLIEALVRLGRREEAMQQLARFLEDAELTGSRWAIAVGGRCRALLAADADAEQAFETALELHEREPNELERARTQLAYGERLRRLRQRRRAREQLHAALESFQRLRARLWAERARAELRASGERLRPRGPAMDEQLTPQELQVSIAAAEGLTKQGDRRAALPQPEDGRVPPQPRLSQARRARARRADQTLRRAGHAAGAPAGVGRARRSTWVPAHEEN